MKEYLKKKGLKLGIIVLAVVLVAAFSTYALHGSAGFFENLAGRIRMPVQKAASAMTDWLEGIYGYLYKYDLLVAENESLRAQLADAQQRARDGYDAVEENKRFRELFGYLEKHSDFDTEASKIVSWNASNWTSSFTISKGSDNGIEQGDAVITEYGVLVGRISELGERWATVSTVIDVDTRIGALVGDDGAAGVVVGNYALMQKGTLQLSYMTEGTQMFVGDVVTTSGMGGGFPQGIEIGTVASVQTEAGGQTEYGIVEPACDLSSLVQVFIIKDFKVEE